MIRYLVAATVAGLCTAAGAAAPAPQISLDTLREVTRTLSDDSFEGRAPATPGEEKTVKYIADRFARAGLKPGNAGSWYQDVPLVELTTTPGAITVTGGRTPLSFAYKTDMVVGTYRVEPRTAVTDSEMVFVGYGINAPEKGWNDYAGVDVRGKTVVILVNDPDWEARDLNGPFGGRAMTYYGRWTYKFEEAARQGAAAALIVHQTEPAAYGFNVVVSSWTGPQLEADAADNHLDQSRAVGWLTNDAARRLFAAAGQDLATLTAAAKRKGFRAVPFTGLKASVTLENGIRRQTSHNVIGVLPGKTRPDEYILYSAHWDHLGRCEAVDGDDICNGAFDNATGVAGLVGLAEAFQKAGAPQRSVIFLAVTAEESGTIGSEYYAAHPLFPLARTVGGANMDEISIYGAARDTILIGGGKSELEDRFRRIAAANGRKVVAEPTPEKGYYYRSDHFSFAKLGVPMIYFEPGDDLVKGGVAAGRKAKAEFEAEHYHAPSDEYDPDWDWSGALADLKLYYAVGRDLADSTIWPNWYPTAEFRKVRDAARAGVK